jgi:hypothetical protein
MTNAMPYQQRSNSFNISHLNHVRSERDLRVLVEERKKGKGQSLQQKRK